jgi:rhodanese-related sulfurtransferase
MRARNFLLILSVSLLLAVYSAGTRGDRDRSAEPDRTISLSGELPLIRLDEAKRLWGEPGTLFLDVRTSADFAVSRIPGAIYFPDEEFEKHFPALRNRLERAKAIVVYCKSTDCGKSLWTAIRLRNQGLTQTKIYPEGWNEWFNNGMPVEHGGP